MSSLPAAPSSPSLLIVDDDPDIRHALQDLLEHEGYLVQSVSTGQEALARVTQQHFHAMILDVGLPDQDGLSLLPVVKQADPLVPVVMISAHVTKEQKAQALRLGAFAWLDKPYSREELKALLRGAIGPAAEIRTEEVERKLLRSQIEQQALLELIPAMVWYKDTHNRIVRANRRAAESINKTVAEIEGQSTYDLYPEEAEKYYQDDLEVISSGQPKLGIVELYQTAFGEKRWVQTDKVPYRDAQGAVMGVLVLAQDISERRRAEEALRESHERFRQLAEHIREVFWLTDPSKTHMIYISPGYEDIWGRTCSSLYDSPQSWLDAIHLDDQPRIRQAMLTQQLTGTYDVEYRIIRPDGTIRWIWDRAFPIRDQTGQVYRIAGIAEDITERKGNDTSSPTRVADMTPT
jgi:PAS domain S-box-containing protein